MSERGDGVLLRSSRQHDRTNLQLAREITANPQVYIPLVVTWAKLVLARLGDGEDMQAQRRLPLGPAVISIF